VTSSPAG